MNKHLQLLAIAMIGIIQATYAQPGPMIKEPAFFKLICQGDLTALEEFLQDNPDKLNERNENGASALHKAISCNQVKVVAHLLEKGLDINVVDKVGRTPLYLAVETSQQEIVDYLKRQNARADFDIITEGGLTLIDRGILLGGLKYVKLFVENGANVNTTNSRGNTPLQIAQRDGFDDIAAYLIAQGANLESASLPVLEGEYLGQDKPGLSPELFAPGFVSNEHGNINVTFHPNGKELYFTIESPHYNWGTIMVTSIQGDIWSLPEPLAATAGYKSWEPFINGDGSKLYFVSNRPINPEDSINTTMDLWVLDRKGNGWGEPRHLGEEINTGSDELHPTISANGKLYYSNRGIYSAQVNGDEVLQSIPWNDPGDTLNWNADPFIAPDESYLIFTSYRPGGLGEGDMYISFRNEDGSWSPSKNMGEGLNSKFNEFPSGLTPDGKYFLFASSRNGPFMPDIYWVDAAVIDNLR